jgi:hypothetical protein
MMFAMCINYLVGDVIHVASLYSLLFLCIFIDQIGDT